MKNPAPWSFRGSLRSALRRACPILALALLPQAAPAAEPAGAPPPKAEYLRLAAEIDTHFREILGLWFPRCLDREAGGFLEEFRRDWSHGQESGKAIVYQARMTWVAAEAAAYSPELRDAFLGYCRHGLAFLVKGMRDAESGGVHFRLEKDGQGKLRPAAEKHAYGLSFAIYAGAAAYRETKAPEALDLARDTFLWLDRNGHDPRGGYFEAFTREGKPILWDGGRRTDAIGTLAGFKSMNSHIHLLEAFTALFRVWPDPRIRERLEELLALVRDRIAVEPGCLNLFFTPDWRAMPAHDSFGHDVETTYLLVEAAEALGRPDDPATWRVARMLVDHALDWGFDEEYGGFYDKGEAFAPAHDTTKVWWTQAEGLNALLLLHERFGSQTRRYYDAFLKQWRFIREHQIDKEHGEWFGSVTREGKLIGGGEKASPWKAAYHNGRALMNCSRMLRRLAGGER